MKREGGPKDGNESHVPFPGYIYGERSHSVLRNDIHLPPRNLSGTSSSSLVTTGWRTMRLTVSETTPFPPFTSRPTSQNGSESRSPEGLSTLLGGNSYDEVQTSKWGSTSPPLRHSKEGVGVGGKVPFPKKGTTKLFAEVYFVGDGGRVSTHEKSRLRRHRVLVPEHFQYQQLTSSCI